MRVFISEIILYSSVESDFVFQDFNGYAKNINTESTKQRKYSAKDNECSFT